MTYAAVPQMHRTRRKAAALVPVVMTAVPSRSWPSPRRRGRTHGGGRGACCAIKSGFEKKGPRRNGAKLTRVQCGNDFGEFRIRTTPSAGAGSKKKSPAGRRG